MEALKAQGLSLEERGFSLDEAYGAREAFVTSATQTVMPVVRIDGRPVGDGKPGPVATALRREFNQFAETG
jgi:D-alanine transaminase